MSGSSGAEELLVCAARGSQASEQQHKAVLMPYLLGQVTFGSALAQTGRGCAHQHVFAKPLYPADDFFEELWKSKKPTHHLQEPGLLCQYSEDLLFGVIEVPELPHGVDGKNPLEHAAQLAYGRLFESLDTHKYPYLWRAWNYMADINTVTHGIERYRQFNAGRQNGFASNARAVTGNVPAACAIGVHDGPLSVAFLAGRTPTITLENPRQVSAYNYPSQYGPRSPTFSRACLAKLSQQELLLLSGTASIVGHETVHAGNVRMQTVETLANIQALVEQANLHTQTANGYRIEDLQVRVYVRRPEDLNTIRSVLAERLGSEHQAIYLHADICRSDLDVEIEGIAWQPIVDTALT
jgi:chorismate lyase / 3-hydroxybenzoate synthase